MLIRNGIGWLSSSSADITRARGIIDSLRKPGVIDELGFLMLNSAFANRFYPGVTTIMTRARYLIFIPAIYRHIEQSRNGVGRDVDKLSRDLQFDLRNALEKNEASFIGKEGRRALIRVPSTIYWGAFESLGIATRAMSESAYQRSLSEGTFGVAVAKDDDGNLHDEDDESLWDRSLKLSHVMDKGAFPASTNFRLRKAEAQFLAERYGRLTADGEESLVTRLVDVGTSHGPESLQGLKYPWQVPGCSPVMSFELNQARLLSLFARGATLQYYAMLLEKKRDEDSRLVAAFAAWWAEAKSDLASWDLSDFFSLVRRWGVGRGKLDEQFIGGWIQRAMAAKSADALLKDGDARRIIGLREDTVRRGKQRLKVKHQLESWRLPNNFSSTYYMDYRHGVGRQIAADIVDGLLRGAV